MFRLAPGVFGLALTALWIWAVFDVIMTDSVLVRNLEKRVWLLLVLFIPTVGAIAWLAVGRPANAGFSPGATYARPTHIDNQQSAPAPRGLEDSDAWRSNTAPSSPSGHESTAAKERRLLEWEAELDKREKGLDD